MSESLAFDLKLIDGVTANAKKAADALRVVESSARKAQGALDFSKERGRADFNLKKLTADPKGYTALIKAQKELREQRNKLLEDAGIKKPESFANGLMSRFSFAKLASSAAVGELVAEGAFKVAESLVEGAKLAVETITDGVKDAFKAAGHEQVLRIGESISLGKGGKEFREDAARQSRFSGFNEGEIRRFELPLRNAGMSQRATRQAFATASDIAAGRGQGGDAGVISDVLGQIKSIYTRKGIGKRQLVDLLGNVGTTIPDFYKELGKKMHVSAKTAEARAEQGGLDPQLLINMITTAQNKKQGGVAGTGGDKYAQSLEARWKKIIALPDLYYAKLADSPGFNRASDAIGSLLDKLDPDGPAGRRIQAAIGDMFENITNLIGDPGQAAETMAAGVENTIQLVRELIPDLKIVGGMFLSAADAAADVAFNMRIAMAASKLDFDQVHKIEAEGANRIIEKKARELEAYTNHQREMREQRESATAVLAAMPLNPLALHQASKPNITIHAPITVQAAPGEDPTHTHQRAGQEAHRHIVNALERAAAEGG